MLKLIKKAVKNLPLIKSLVSQRDMLRQSLDEMFAERKELRMDGYRLRQQRDLLTAERDELVAHLEPTRLELKRLKRNQGVVEAGHFYSPIPSFDQIAKDQSRIFDQMNLATPGVDLNAEAQLQLLGSFVDFYRDLPFTPDKIQGLRYYFENPAYSYSDAILLHCMMRHLKPNRVIEVGSGFSSCMILDTNELFFKRSIKTTFIEPHPELLQSLLEDTENDNIEIIPSQLQHIDLSLFDELQANDILFIDSTHVSKIDSDVNRIIFEILPRLASGVYIHFHDIIYPFEYPRKWVLQGRAWNEAYLLKAFLQFNHSFRTVLMNSYLNQFHREFFEENMPLCLNNTGASIWIRKD